MEVVGGAYEEGSKSPRESINAGVTVNIFGSVRKVIYTLVLLMVYGPTSAKGDVNQVGHPAIMVVEELTDSAERATRMKVSWSALTLGPGAVGLPQVLRNVRVNDGRSLV